jgi:hypothetical protein
VGRIPAAYSRKKGAAGIRSPTVVRSRVGTKDFPFGMNPLRDYEAPPVPNRAAYLPIHCKTIRTRCNAIQTLLQLNSNNYTICGFPIYFAVAGFRG